MHKIIYLCLIFYFIKFRCFRLLKRINSNLNVLLGKFTLDNFVYLMILCLAHKNILFSVIIEQLKYR